MQALAEIRGRGTNRVADALAQSADHVLDSLPPCALSLPSTSAV